MFSRSFTIKVHQGLCLNQLRLFAGDSTLDDAQLRHLYRIEPLLYNEYETPLALTTVQLDGGLFMGIDTVGSQNQIVGYKAKKTVTSSIFPKLRSTIHPRSGNLSIIQQTDRSTWSRKIFTF